MADLPKNIRELLDKLFNETFTRDEARALLRVNLTRSSTYDLRETLKRLGEPVPRNLMANAARSHARRFKQDLIEIAIEKANLSEFHYANGRLNQKALARNIQSQLMARNESLNVDYRKSLNGIGLRNFVNAIEERLENKSEKKLKNLVDVYAQSRNIALILGDCHCSSQGLRFAI